MIRLNNILVAIDFSTVSEGAAAFALKLSKKQKAELHLLTVDVTKKSASASDEISDTPVTPTDRRFQEQDERLASHVEAHDELAIQCRIVQDGAASPGILDYAARYGIDLIVTGTRGRTGVRRIFLGSVAAEVVRTAACPVLTVRTGEGNPPEHVRNILVPVDFSAPTRGAISYGAGLARLFDAELYLIHVMETMDDEEPNRFKPSAFGTAERYRRTKESLCDLAKGLDVEASMQVLDGDPTDSISNFAVEQDIDLIVMPTRGQSGWQRLLMGSVAERVICTAPCPVLSARDFAPYLQSDETVKRTVAPAPPRIMESRLSER